MKRHLGIFRQILDRVTQKQELKSYKNKCYFFLLLIWSFKKWLNNGWDWFKLIDLNSSWEKVRLTLILKLLSYNTFINNCQKSLFHSNFWLKNKIWWLCLPTPIGHRSNKQRYSFGGGGRRGHGGGERGGHYISTNFNWTFFLLSSIELSKSGFSFFFSLNIRLKRRWA